MGEAVNSGGRNRDDWPLITVPSRPYPVVPGCPAPQFPAPPPTIGSHSIWNGHFQIQ